MDLNNILSKSSFSMLEGKIDGRILKALAALGYNKPTQIQVKTLPHILFGHDVIGAAKTGSGKTLAFLIPVIENLIKLQFSKKQGNISLIIDLNKIFINNALKTQQFY